jgi:hypothetical protein
MPSTDGADYPYFPQLLDADGSYFPQMVVVQKYLPPYTNSFFVTQTVGTNETAFTSMGDPQEISDGFSIECWGVGAYRQLKEAIGKEETHGFVILRVPDLDDLSGATGDSYLIRFYEAQMSRMYPRRKGAVQVFTADISGPIEIHGHETY